MSEKELRRRYISYVSVGVVSIMLALLFHLLPFMALGVVLFIFGAAGLSRQRREAREKEAAEQEKPDVKPDQGA